MTGQPGGLAVTWDSMTAAGGVPFLCPTPRRSVTGSGC
jgi:hypothetical protein